MPMCYFLPFGHNDAGTWSDRTRWRCRCKTNRQSDTIHIAFDHLFCFGKLWRPRSSFIDAILYIFAFSMTIKPFSNSVQTWCTITQCDVDDLPIQSSTVNRPRTCQLQLRRCLTIDQWLWKWNGERPGRIGHCTTRLFLAVCKLGGYTGCNSAQPERAWRHDSWNDKRLTNGPKIPTSFNIW